MHWMFNSNMVHAYLHKYNKIIYLRILLVHVYMTNAVKYEPFSISDQLIKHILSISMKSPLVVCPLCFLLIFSVHPSVCSSVHLSKNYLGNIIWNIDSRTFMFRTHALSNAISIWHWPSVYFKAKFCRQCRIPSFSECSCSPIVLIV